MTEKDGYTIEAPRQHRCIEIALLTDGGSAVFCPLSHLLTVAKCPFPLTLSMSSGMKVGKFSPVVEERSGHCSC
jgi:hypothetical protein